MVAAFQIRPLERWGWFVVDSLGTSPRYHTLRPIADPITRAAKPQYPSATSLKLRADIAETFPR